VLWYAKFESIIRVKRKFRYDVRPLDDESIRRWCEQVKETDNVEEILFTERPRRSDEDHVRQAFIRDPKMSISRAIAEVTDAANDVHRILWKRLRLQPY
jgi:hypothetical protein